ncbi:hypothetical protein PF003_g32603 [Phytophthora fragariae]|nr:hypothetical protein PF003_g32603 [Phytophthora fragariae]
MGILSALEEILLHQEKLEKIEVIGTLCLKAADSSCEFFNKLDLTVNFVDFDTLEESIDHLKPLRHLRELYMLGNTCQANWETGFREFVVASLPQLEIWTARRFTAVTGSRRCRCFEIDKCSFGARPRRCAPRRSWSGKRRDGVIEVVGGEATDISEDQVEKKKSVMASTEKVPYTPRRTRDARCIWRLPSRRRRGRRDDVRTSRKSENTEAEHGEASRKARVQEAQEDGAIRQWQRREFRLMDEILDVILEVDLPRFLDSSLVDVDVHPSYVLHRCEE